MSVKWHYSNTVMFVGTLSISTSTEYDLLILAYALKCFIASSRSSRGADLCVV